jgi:hypothetical protein
MFMSFSQRSNRWPTIQELVTPQELITAATLDDLSVMAHTSKRSRSVNPNI